MVLSRRGITHRVYEAQPTTEEMRAAAANIVRKGNLKWSEARLREKIELQYSISHYFC